MEEHRPAEDGLTPRGHDLQEPEQAELARLRGELQGLYEEAIAREMKVERLRAQIDGFAHEHLLRLGPLLAERDELDAQIAEALLAKKPEDPILGRRAQEARARARTSSEQAVEAGEKGPIHRVTASEDLKELYRAAALRMHPDLGRQPEDREVRHEFMAKLNTAFKNCDRDAIEELIARWDAVASPPPDTDVGEKLVRVIRAIDRLRKTIERLGTETKKLRQRPDHTLMVEASRASAEGRDLLAEYEAKLREQIQRKRETLNAINGGGTS